MTLKIAQDATPKDGHRWAWSVWLEGSAAELDNVCEVVWKLHPTFSPSVIQRTSRGNNFKLKTSGWGEFMIAADVKMKAGGSKLLTRWLKLGTTGLAKDDAAAKKGWGKIGVRQVFLSYSADNANLASHVAKALEDGKYRVARELDVPSGVSIQDWTREQIANSDAVVVLGAEEPSLYQAHEVKFAQSVGKTVVPVATAKVTSQSPLMEGTVEFVQATGNKPEKVAMNLVQQIDKLL